MNAFSLCFFKVMKSGKEILMKIDSEFIKSLMECKNNRDIAIFIKIYLIGTVNNFVFYNLYTGFSGLTTKSYILES